MSDSNSDTPVVSPDTDDLDAFSALLNGKANEAPPSAEATAEEPVKEDDNSEEDTLATDDEDTETQATDDDTDDLDEDQKVEATEKPKKNRFQERIDQLVQKNREDRAALEAQIALLSAQIAPKPTPNEGPTPTSAAPKDQAPSPDDRTEDGRDKYPLGEYDPNYMRDTLRYENAKFQEQLRQEQLELLESTKKAQAQQALDAEWGAKLNSAFEKYPDMPEKNAVLEPIFEALDPTIGEYLGNVIKDLEYGTDVLYYLASNPSEAKTILNGGATKAVIALGRIEAQFANSQEPPKQRVSKAPPPPTRLNKGTQVSKEVPGDTDDLDAFATQLFNKKSRKW